MHSLKNEVPTKKALENYDDFGLDQSISDYPDNQVCLVFNQEFLLLTLISNICTNSVINTVSNVQDFPEKILQLINPKRQLIY